MTLETYEILDRRFASLENTTARLYLLDATSRWAEGPAYVPAGRYLLWSDVPSDRIMRWDEVHLWRELSEIASQEPFKVHRDSWVTERDFVYLAANGIELVRIPVRGARPFEPGR